MAKGTCSFGGDEHEPRCGASLYCKGFCTRHYQRWKRTGSPSLDRPITPRGMPVRERIASRIDVDADGCWLWPEGSCNSRGYAHLAVVGYRTRRAARIAYMEFIGPIPVGLELDHLCRVRRCVNPWHLEPVTPEENKRRARRDNPQRGKHLSDACHKGHPWTPENTYVRRDNGMRQCRVCNRERDAARRRVPA